MLCALSGQEPEEPVISKSGHVFEKRLITKYLEENDNCPVTNELLDVSELIAVKASTTVKPRPASATSIPGMLQLFQNEWDVTVLESYTLRKQLETVRQQLAHALYQQDAACRVIARLIKERDEARRLLVEAQGTANSGQVPASSTAAPAVEDEPMEEEEEDGGIPANVVEEMTTCAKELSVPRKTRNIPEGTASRDAVSGMKSLLSRKVHSASVPGVTCVAFHPSDDNLVVTGGVDKSAVIFSRKTKKVVSKLTGHKKAVTSVAFHPEENMILTSSADKTVRVWSEARAGKYDSVVVEAHSGVVSGLTLHPLNTYFVSASEDGTWAFCDIEGNVISKTSHKDKPTYKSVQFHPDGLLLGTGAASGNINIWDIKSQRSAVVFKGHANAAASLSFSENGYYMASVDEGAVVKVWDLRKVKPLCSMDLDMDTARSVSFDFSGQYLAVGGTDVQVFALDGKKLAPIASHSDHGDVVTGVAWNKDASMLATSSMDRTFRVFGA